LADHPDVPPVSAAASAGNLTLLKALLEMGRDLNVEYDGKTAQESVSEGGHTECASAIEKGVNVIPAPFSTSSSP
jgi:hypothetical protein